MIELRAVGAGDAEPLRALRLRALADAPGAFAAAFESESRRPSRDWRALAQRSAVGREDRIVVAVRPGDGEWVGLAGGRWFARAEAIAALWGLWVAPDARGRGTGRALVGAVQDWARAHEARFLRLGVAEAQAGARRLYAALGYVELDDPQAMRADPSRRWIAMARPI